MTSAGGYHLEESRKVLDFHHLLGSLCRIARFGLSSLESAFGLWLDHRGREFSKISFGQIEETWRDE